MAYIYDLTDTWNAGGTTFNAIKMNVTDSASASASKLVTLQANGTEHFSVTKGGQGYFSGNLGVGTTSPGYKLDVVGGNGDGLQYRTPTRAVGIGQISSEPSVFWGSGTPLTFFSGSERMRIDASGNLLVGTTAAQSGLASDAVGLTLFGLTAPGTAVFTRNSINPVVYVNNKTSGGGLVQFYNGGNQVGSIDSNGTTTSYVTTSDARLKHDIVDAPDAANLIDAIQVRSFKWNADNSEQRYGFIAQELLEVAPEAVSQPADPEEMMGVDYSKLVPMLVKELQSLRARVAQLEGN
jgi:hypothetical protein